LALESKGAAAALVGGRVSFYLPGGPCLACADELDFAEASEDLESEAARRIRLERGYARQRNVEPALMPLNTVIVGLGMIELLAFATGTRRTTRFQRYDAAQSKVVQVNVGVDNECPVCQPAHAMGPRQNITRYALTNEPTTSGSWAQPFRRMLRRKFLAQKTVDG
jgi:hypothetical protein